jgi:hypothetical protein
MLLFLTELQHAKKPRNQVIISLYLLTNSQLGEQKGYPLAEHRAGYIIVPAGANQPAK